jgi:eukaryotic-like serine/threonine-protein kinase
MAQVLRLTVVTGPHRGDKYCFRANAECLVGRAPDCFVQMVGSERDQYISRHHCRLALDDTSLTLHDLNSKAGTYLDGEQVDSVALSLPSCHCDGCGSRDRDFDQGSLLTLGGTTFRLHVVDCPPKAAAVAETQVWSAGETAKKNCPVRCG